MKYEYRIRIDLSEYDNVPVYLFKTLDPDSWWYYSVENNLFQLKVNSVSDTGSFNLVFPFHTPRKIFRDNKLWVLHNSWLNTWTASLSGYSANGGGADFSLDGITENPPAEVEEKIRTNDFFGCENISPKYK